MRNGDAHGAPGGHVPRAVFDHILNVARRLASSSDLHEVLGLIIDTLRDSLRADRASVFQYDPATHELFATQAHGLPKSLRLPADKGIIGEAAKSGQIVNIPDAYADARFNRSVDDATGYRTRCLLTIPLNDYEGRLVGVAQVLNKAVEHGGTFNDDDEDLARILADQAAVALKRAALVEAERIKQKLEADIGVAKKIQRAALPSALPSVPGYDIAAHFHPADETGGDAFDIIDLSVVGQPRYVVGPHPGAVIFMADATGHGIGPALSVAQVLAMVRMGARLNTGVDHAARHINRQLCRDLPAGRFVTSFIGHLNVTRHELAYFSAGQAPLVFIHRDAPGPAGVQVENANAMPFGIDDELRADPVRPFRFAPGDVFVLLSDGYYEAPAPDDELFGIDRVVETVRAHIDEPAAAIVERLRGAVRAFGKEGAAPDDQTAVLIKRTAP